MHKSSFLSLFSKHHGRPCHLHNICIALDLELVEVKQRTCVAHKRIPYHVAEGNEHMQTYPQDVLELVPTDNYTLILRKELMLG